MKLHYGWVVVAAGALLGCVAMGSTFSLAVFLQPMSEATGWSRTGVSLAMTGSLPHFSMRTRQSLVIVSSVLCQGITSTSGIT